MARRRPASIPASRPLVLGLCAALLAGCGQSEQNGEEGKAAPSSKAQTAARESAQKAAPPSNAGTTADVGASLTLPEPGADGWAEAQSRYLEAFAEREGVQTTESGVYYEVLQPGEGASPKPGDTVRVQYEGRLITGKVFDSSYERGAPASFPANQVIQGWQDVLVQMKEGATWRVAIPADLGYGSRAMGEGAIPANSALVFTIELIEAGA